MTQQLQGTFLSFSENVHEQKGQKSYDFFKVNYRDSQGNNKTYSGFQNALKYNRELSNNLRKLQQGDSIILVIGKNKAGYDELQAVSVVNGAAKNETRSPATTGNAGNSGGAAPARQYSGETPEERAKRQILIVKQSSLSSAVETVKQDKKVPTTEEVLTVAQEYFDWVMSDGKVTAAKEVQQESPARGPTIDLEDDVPF